MAAVIVSSGRKLSSVHSSCSACANGVTLRVPALSSIGRLVETSHIKVSNYLHVPAMLGAGMPDEREPHYYFHRSLGPLLGACFAAELVLDGLEESAFSPADGAGRSPNWASFTDTPPVLVARLRPAGRTTLSVG